MKKASKKAKLVFPKGFLWGAATAAHQVEGNNIHSDWWAWEQKGGGTEPSGPACDHYHRFEDDFELAKKLNHNTHRLSIEWARIEPEEGKWNQEAIEHYKRVLESLKEKKIKAFVTLFHFTLPLWFAKKGGFEKKENLKYFDRYVDRMAHQLGDLVDFWITINEPNVYLGSSYLGAYWPPQKKNPLKAIKVYLNLAKVHKKAYDSIHHLQKKAQVGMTMAMNIATFPFLADSLPGRGLFKITKFLANDSFYFLTRNCHDFLGINYYYFYDFSLKDLLILKKLNLKNIEKTIGLERSDLDWPIYPQGIHEVLLDLKKYKLPIYITENGLADAQDKLRARFILNHLQWIHQAIKEGVDVRGYIYWTLMDNYEWAFGFKPRFGLIEIDYKTQKRTTRKSALAYAKICQENAILLE